MDPLLASFSGMLSAGTARVIRLLSEIRPAHAGLVVGCLATACAIACICRRRATRWIAVRARLVRCTADVVPAVIFATRKIIQFNYTYTYEAEGSTREGSSALTQTRDIYFDPRRLVREQIAAGEIEIVYDRLHPNCSRLSRPRTRKPMIMLVAGLGVVFASLAALATGPRPGGSMVAAHPGAVGTIPSSRAGAGIFSPGPGGTVTRGPQRPPNSQAVGQSSTGVR